MSAQHSPTPWIIRREGYAQDYYWSLWGDNGRFVCALMERLIPEAHEEAARNGDFIVQCVNAHDALVRAAAVCLAHLDRINPPTGAYWSGASDQEALRAAIAAATSHQGGGE